MDEAERRIREERARVEAEYRQVLRTSVEFEKRIRDRWREKIRQKNRRIAELERQVAELQRQLEKGRSGQGRRFASPRESGIESRESQDR